MNHANIHHPNPPKRTSLRNLRLAQRVAWLLLISALTIKPSATASVEVANSSTEFSNIQGANGWYYGYSFATSSYDPAQNFQLLPLYGAAPVNRTAWYLSPNSWLSIDRTLQHPNSNGVQFRDLREEWAIRRWQSDVAGTVNIAGTVSKADNFNSADGTAFNIFVNGTSIFSTEVHNTTPISFSVPYTVQAGSTIDFIVRPQSNDFNDSTRLSAAISMIAPAQKVYLAWNTTVPVAVQAKQSLFGTTRYVVEDGTMAAATADPTFRLQVQNSMQQMFTNSGIENVAFTTTPTPGATTIYFADPIDDRLLGKAYTGIDRFNRRSDDGVVVFLQPDTEKPFGFNLERVAETAAHELGHSLGLRHVNPGGNEIMDYYDSPGVADQFLNTVSPITEPPTNNGTQQSQDHNPRYHLERYIDGTSREALASQGILPGEWDQTFLERIVLSLDFGANDLTLFDVYLLTGEGDTESMLTLAHFDQITLGELAALEFDVSPTSFLELLAASALGGSLDTVLATGDPYQETNLSIPIVDGQTSAFLQRHSASPGGFATVGSATLSGTTVPEPSTAIMLLVTLAASALKRWRNVA